ncbi:sperm microtubule associated protein 2-like [Polymixia lowei]
METWIEQLARPKPNLLRYPDRRSVYWLDELPPKRTGSGTKFELTPRWSNLCKSKKSFLGFEQIRVSPIWVVSEGALKAHASDRLCSLARPRPHAAGWQPDRPLLAPLTSVVQNVEVTPRICQLAQPKRRLDVEASTLPKTSLASRKPPKASPRIELLATPKHDHPKYAGERPLSWRVPGAARRAAASDRVLELSHPKERKALFEGYDPYVVSQAARSASPSPRLRALCLPLPRKCKTK